MKTNIYHHGFFDMDRSKLPREFAYKLVGRTWIALADLKDTDRISIVIGIKADDLNCLSILESKGFQLYLIYQNSTNTKFYTVMRCTDKGAEKCPVIDIIYLAAIDCVRSIEIGTSLRPEHIKN